MTRWLLALLLLAVPDVAPARPHYRPAPLAAAIAPMPAPEHVILAASGGRSVDVSVLPARHSRGVILFGHGYGGQPSAYVRLIERLWRAGYSVVAPLSVDSFAGPLKGQVEPQRAFATRIEDMALSRGYIARRFARQPVVLAGHSFGSLMALIGAGAKTPAGKIDGPPIVGVIAFSTAGSVPGLIGPDSFAGIDLPLLLVTGDADIVPGFVTDWHDHRRAFDESRPGNKTLVVVRGGNHEMVGKADPPIFAAISGAAVDFANAFAARQPAARRRLAGLHSTATTTVEHR